MIIHMNKNWQSVWENANKWLVRIGRMSVKKKGFWVCSVFTVLFLHEMIFEAPPMPALVHHRCMSWRQRLDGDSHTGVRVSMSADGSWWDHPGCARSWSLRRSAPAVTGWVTSAWPDSGLWNPQSLLPLLCAQGLSWFRINFYLVCSLLDTGCELVIKNTF